MRPNHKILAVDMIGYDPPPMFPNSYREYFTFILGKRTGVRRIHEVDYFRIEIYLTINLNWLYKCRNNPL